MIRPFSIALLYGGEKSKRYASLMQEVILNETKEYPYIPVMIDSEYWNKHKMARYATIPDIIEKLGKCDFVYLFLSAFYNGHDMYGEEMDVDRIIPRLNPIFEYGYMFHALGKERIAIIPDVEYSEIEKKHFVFVSDRSHWLWPDRKHIINEEMKEESKESTEALKDALTTWFKSDMDDMRKKRVVLNAENMMNYDKLVFNCPSYTINYQALFINDFEKIKKYSLAEQINTVLDIWANEISEFDEEINIGIVNANEMLFSYKIMYCYERLLLFLSIQKNDMTWTARLRFIQSGTTYNNSSHLAVIRIYNEICEYITYMREYKDRRSTVFFETKAETLERCLKELKSQSPSLNPLIIAIAENYIGLAYLNASYFLPKSEKKTNYLKKAEDSFSEVIALCEDPIHGVLRENNSSVILSYVYFNLARVQQNQKQEYTKWNWSFEQSIQFRSSLADDYSFPEFIRLHFLKERFHAETTRYECMIPIWKKNQQSDNIEIRKVASLALEESKVRLDKISDEMAKYELIYLEQGSNPFFKDIKEQIKRIAKEQQINN